jgi:hypothetical protein
MVNLLEKQGGLQEICGPLFFESRWNTEKYAFSFPGF